MARKKAVETMQIESAVYEILEQDNPLTLRNIYYTLLGINTPFAFPKSEASYKKLARITGDMRKRGVLPYEWIEDGTRQGVYWAIDRNVDDYLNSLREYQTSAWIDASDYVEVWVESRSLAGIVRNTCGQYRVPMIASGGRPSLSLTFEGANRIIETCGINEHSAYRMLYIGDCDNDGLGIFDNVVEHLEHHLHAYPFERDYQWLAVTEQHIEQYGLITKPPGRPKGGHAVLQAAEAEAMQKDVLLSILSDAIEQYLPAGNLAQAQSIEKREQERMRAYFGLVQKMADRGIDAGDIEI